MVNDVAFIENFKEMCLHQDFHQNVFEFLDDVENILQELIDQQTSTIEVKKILRVFYSLLKAHNLLKL